MKLIYILTINGNVVSGAHATSAAALDKACGILGINMTASERADHVDDMNCTGCTTILSEEERVTIIAMELLT